MEAVIYTRVSRDIHNGRSVEDQERECRSECERKGWPVRGVYCDNSISASRYGGRRPEWERLKADLSPGEVLVVWEASRTARDLEEFVTLRNLCADRGVSLSYSGRVLDLTLGDDRFVGGLDALIAERESEQIRVRTLRGKRSSALRGRPAGRLPWGYRRVDAGMWEPDPIEAPRIRQAVERILNGESTNAVFEWIVNTEGYTPSTLTVMTRSLRKASLAGFRTHQGELIGKGQWTPIITEAQHEQLVARLDRKRKAYAHIRRGPKPRHLLSYIAVCGVCGLGVRWRPPRRDGARPGYCCPKGHCSRIEELLDAEVERRLFERLATIDPSQFEDGSALESLWGQIELLETRHAEWLEKAVAGEVSPTSFVTIEKEILGQIQNLKERAREHAPGEVDLVDVTENWKELPISKKRAIVRAFFTITINRTRRGRSAGLDGVEISPI